MMENHKLISGTPPTGKSRTTEKVAGAVTATVLAATAMAGLGTAPANATCIGLSGININLGGGGGCLSTLGNFALGLGTGTVADASGGFLNGAIAVGTNVAAFAEGSGFSVANVALNLGAADDPIDPATGVPTGPAFSRVTAGPGVLNLGANFFGNATNSDPAFEMDIKASGVASSALNFIGNRNRLTSSGVLANSTVVGNFFEFPNGSDNDVTSNGPVSVAFVRQGLFTDNSAGCPSICGNTVTANPFSIAGAFNTVGRDVTSGPGNRISIAFPFNDNGTTASTFAAPTTFANGSSNGSGGSQLNGSLTKAGKHFGSSLSKVGANVKAFNDNVKKAISSLAKKNKNTEDS